MAPTVKFKAPDFHTFLLGNTDFHAFFVGKFSPSFSQEKMLKIHSEFHLKNHKNIAVNMPSAEILNLIHFMCEKIHHFFLKEKMLRLYNEFRLKFSQIRPSTKAMKNPIYLSQILF